MEFLKWFWSLMTKYALDERGFAGDAGGDGGGENDKGGDGGGQDDKGGDALKNAIDGDFTLNLDEVLLDDGEGEDDDAGKDKGKGKQDDKGGTKDDGQKKTLTLDELSAKVTQLENDKSNLKKALHEERQEKKRLAKDKKGDGDEEPLSKAQLLKIMEEHQDDPATLLNIIEYQAKQVARGVKKDALSEAEMSSRKKEADALVRERIPNLDDDTSDNRIQINHVKSALGLDDHPLGDLFAAGVIAFHAAPKIKEYWYEQGKKDALADKGRKEDIEDGKLGGTKKGQDKGGGSKVSGATVKQLGLSPRQQKIYEKLIAGKPRSVSMEE